MPLHFVHIPKTGGTSIEEAYRGHQPFGRYAFFSELASARERAHCAFWHEHAPVLTVMPGASSFCVVRDPIARLLSEYRYRSLPDDVNVFNATLRDWRARIAKSAYFMQNHFRQQVMFARQCTHCLLVDELDTTLPALLRRYHITPRPMRHANRSKRYSVVTGRASLSADNLAWVNEFYRDDFVLFKRLLRAAHNRQNPQVPAPRSVFNCESANTSAREVCGSNNPRGNHPTSRPHSQSKKAEGKWQHEKASAPSS